MRCEASAVIDTVGPAESHSDKRPRLQQVLPLEDVCASATPRLTRLCLDVFILVYQLLEGHVALWMAQHPRLGRASPLYPIDEYALALIIDFAFGGSICVLPVGPGPGDAAGGCSSPPPSPLRG